MSNEQERAAYMAGDINTANLLARIEELTEALGRAVAEIEDLTCERDSLVAELREVME
jgi:hypothetical protein